MNEQEYLNEEKYKKNKKNLLILAIIVLFIGLIISGSLITLGFLKIKKVNKEFSQESKDKIKNEISIEENKLQEKKNFLISKGVTYDYKTTYSDGEAYDLEIITEVLDPKTNNCNSDEYKNNDITMKYCDLKEQDELLNEENEKSYEMSLSIPFFVVGGFVLLISIVWTINLFLIIKRREISAFVIQQEMPLANEGIEKITPTIGKNVKEIAKNIKEEIDESNKINCVHCDKLIDSNSVYCKYCGKKNS